MIRLDKYLADMGVGTRQEVKKKIRQGQVRVNDEIARAPEKKISDSDQVFCDGMQVSYVTHEYYMLNKPSGVVSATEDASCRTVIDLIAERKRKDLFPVGRLDKDTEGLLFITNDGELAHRLLSPKKHVDKVYYAKVAGAVSEEDKAAFLQGVNIGTKEKEEWTRPGELQILDVGEKVSTIRLTIREGKYHQVKRMFQAVGKEVLYLKRESMGTLTLDPLLAPGSYRALTEKERKELEKEVGL